MRGTLAIALFAAVVGAPLRMDAQERGANALGELIQHLGVSARVLMIGAHPDDEDTQLIAWLQRGRGVETAYLSLTRGDGGQNLIGNELGEALGVIRTGELLAARQIDGARQYFTRAYDFGYSKDTVDTYAHWPRDSILSDVVRVVRAFRPHVIVSVFSGTTRDGHGHHQVAGLLARAAYDVSGDTTRFSAAGYGGAWTVPKFYRAARGSAQNGTLGVDVGEYSPLLGRSYGEIAGESRSQHKSQGFGALERKGPIMNYVRREASRVNEAQVANTERSMFDGIDTSWSRFRGAIPDSRLDSALDSLRTAVVAIRASLDPYAPDKLVAPLSRISTILVDICRIRATICEQRVARGVAPSAVLNGDLWSSLLESLLRTQEALHLASGVVVQAESLEELPVGALIPVFTTVHNTGKDTIGVSIGLVTGSTGPTSGPARRLLPGGVLRDTVVGSPDSLVQPWWLAGGRTGGVFSLPAATSPAGLESGGLVVGYTFMLQGGRFDRMLTVNAPVQWRYADQVKGEVVRRVVGVPLVTVTPEATAQVARAGVALDRVVTVRVRSAPEETVSEARVTLVVPAGLSVDSATRIVALRNVGDDKTVAFRVRGRLAAGSHRITASAEVNGRTYASAVQVIDYDHIHKQRIYRPSSIALTAVDVTVPTALRVAYVIGVGDNSGPLLSQLGIPTTIIAPADLASADLSRFSTVVIGPRAYDANPELAAANPKLFEFARNGGTLVVQYGQYEMTRPGMTTYPIAISRPHPRVTHEDAPVTILDANARALTWPNRISAADFDGWVQERGLYMPRTFDPQYKALLSMNDPGEPPITGGILVAPVGRGTYVYTSLSFFRQLPAGVPGAARLFVNLLSAGLPPAGAR